MLFTQVRPTSPRMTSRRSLLRFTAPPPTSFSHSATPPHSEEADQLALHASTITWTRRRSLNQSTDSSEYVILACATFVSPTQQCRALSCIPMYRIFFLLSLPLHFPLSFMEKKGGGRRCSQLSRPATFLIRFRFSITQLADSPTCLSLTFLTAIFYCALETGWSV